MKKYFLLALLITASVYSFCQDTSKFSSDADRAFGLMKNGAFKHGYQYLIKFATTDQAAISVEPNTGYLIFFLYDNTNHPATYFKAMLMTPDSVLQKKYTGKPYDRAQVGVARAAQLEFRTPAFTGAATRPVKLIGKPPANIYVFYKK
jgi:hypothetical protein